MVEACGDFSAGQKQLHCLARALLTNAGILAPRTFDKCILHLFTPKQILVNVSLGCAKAWVCCLPVVSSLDVNVQSHLHQARSSIPCSVHLLPVGSLDA
jgi:hypothetical protein